MALFVDEGNIDCDSPGMERAVAGFRVGDISSVVALAPKLHLRRERPKSIPNLQSEMPGPQPGLSLDETRRYFRPNEGRCRRRIERVPGDIGGRGVTKFDLDGRIDHLKIDEIVINGGRDRRPGSDKQRQPKPGDAAHQETGCTFASRWRSRRAAPSGMSKRRSTLSPCCSIVGATDDRRKSEPGMVSQRLD